VSEVAKRRRACGQPNAPSRFEVSSSNGQPGDENITRAASASRGRPRDRARRSRHTYRMGNYAVSTSHRDPLATQVTVWRGNASRGKLREASASSMGIRAVRSESSCGQPCEGAGFTSGSAQWSSGVDRATERRSKLPRLEQPVRWGERRSCGRPWQRRWLQRAGDPCSRGCFTARETGWRGGSAVRVPRAVDAACSPGKLGGEAARSTSAPCSEVEVVASGNRSDGGDLMARATHA